MPFFKKTADARAQLNALSKSQAVIEFNLDGTILTANENFLKTLGYTLEEIQGKHHSMFVTPEDRDSEAYKNFWASLARGEFQATQYKRVAKGGREVWIQASYNPIFDAYGKPYKVVKYATDITKDRLATAERDGQVSAISRSQAVIEFELDGTIIGANENFLATLGYSLEEIRGKHHSMFVTPEEKMSDAYRQFWAALARGEYQAAQYKRVGKGGKEVWIQASYNPIYDMNGKPFKVVKYATDITGQVDLLNKIQSLIGTNLGNINHAVQSVSAQVSTVANASMETSSSVQAVASGAEELNASVREIAQSMSYSQQAVHDMSGKTKVAEDYTKRLAATAANMTGIVDLIHSIASQINLLSLNATIESARAGEAGKGFAVVASEVKNLATQAATATDQISNEILAIQEMAKEVNVAVADIGQSIVNVENYIATTASAVEEQSSVTHTMSENMQSAATAVANIGESMSQIEGAIANVNTATTSTQDAAKSLAA